MNSNNIDKEMGEVRWEVRDEVMWEVWNSLLNDE
jgi:hypothetical protein